MTRQRLAPASWAASSRLPVDAGHRIEDRHDHEQRVEMDVGDDHGEVREQQEGQRLMRRCRAAISALLNTPLRPRNGIHEIMRMMFEVQNGTVHSRNKPDLPQQAAHVEHQEVRHRKADHRA